MARHGPKLYSHTFSDYFTYVYDESHSYRVMYLNNAIIAILLLLNTRARLLAGSSKDPCTKRTTVEVVEHRASQTQTHPTPMSIAVPPHCRSPPSCQMQSWHHLDLGLDPKPVPRHESAPVSSRPGQRRPSQASGGQKYTPERRADPDPRFGRSVRPPQTGATSRVRPGQQPPRSAQTIPS